MRRTNSGDSERGVPKKMFFTQTSPIQFLCNPEYQLSNSTPPSPTMALHPTYRWTPTIATNQTAVEPSPSHRNETIPNEGPTMNSYNTWKELFTLGNLTDRFLSSELTAEPETMYGPFDELKAHGDDSDLCISDRRYRGPRISVSLPVLITDHTGTVAYNTAISFTITPFHMEDFESPVVVFLAITLHNPTDRFCESIPSSTNSPSYTAATGPLDMTYRLGTIATPGTLDVVIPDPGGASTAYKIHQVHLQICNFNFYNPVDFDLKGVVFDDEPYCSEDGPKTPGSNA